MTDVLAVGIAAGGELLGVPDERNPVSDDLDDPSERLTRLFHEHSSRVLSYLLHRGAGDAGPDLLSETFAVAWRRIDDVPDPALAWLLVVARNALAHHWRSLGRREALRGELVRLHGAAVTGGADVAEAVVERSEVLAALASLSEQDREVLVLTGWDGLSTAEGAVVLGCAPGAFAVRLHRARRRLQRLLDVTEDGWDDSRDPVPTPSPLATVSEESR